MIGQTNSIWKVNSKQKQLINYIMLYDYGNECTDITGGWSGYACTTSTSSQYGKVAPTVTKNEDHIYVTKTAQNALGCLLTANKIDVSDYVLFDLCGYFSSKGNQYAWQHLAMVDGNSGVVSSIKKVGIVANNEKTGIATMDLSEINKSGYLGIEYYYYGITTYTKMYWAALFKADDWQTLANKAGIAASSIDDILTNSTTLLSNDEAVEFMIYRCTGNFMVSAVQSETFLTALNNSPYKTIIMANEHWAKFLNMIS